MSAQIINSNMVKESLADFLVQNSAVVATALNKTLSPSFTENDFSKYMDTLGRIMHAERVALGKQAEAVCAIENHFKTANAVILSSATGTGKTTMAGLLATAHNVVYAEVPPHLLEKTEREMREILGVGYGFKMKIVKSTKDVHCLTTKGKAPTEPTFFVVSKETAARTYSVKTAVNVKLRRASELVKQKNGDKATVAWMEYCYCCPDCANVMKAVAKDDMLALANKRRPSADEIMDAKALKPHMSEDEVIAELKLQKAIDGSGPTVKEAKCKKCGAVALQPSRGKMSVAEFLKRYGVKGRIDLGISDEFHESKGADTYRAQATGTLIGLSKKFVGMTGTLLGGYASHLFPLLFRMFPTFMVKEMGYKWNNQWDFVEEFGGIEHRFDVGTYDATIGDFMPGDRGFGRHERPDLSPRLLDILMPFTVFLRLDEIKFFEESGMYLPPRIEKKHMVSFEPEFLTAYLEYVKDLTEIARGGDTLQDVTEGGDRGPSRMTRELVKNLISSTRTDSRKAFSRLNIDALLIPDSPFEPRTYTGKVFDAKLMKVVDKTATYTPPCSRLDIPVTNKEQKLLDIVMENHTNGRKVLVYVDFVESGVNSQLAELIATRLGLKAHVLRSEDVDAKKREKHIHAIECDVLITNPALVQTGLDLLEYPTIVFYEQMYSSYNVFTMRQAMMRSWRIGQTENVEIHMLAYASTQQQNCAILMGGKISVSTGVEGILSTGDDMASLAEDENIQIAMARKLLNGDLGDNVDSTDENVINLNVREWNPFEQFYIAQMKEFKTNPEKFAQYAPSHLLVKADTTALPIVETKTEALEEVSVAEVMASVMIKEVFEELVLTEPVVMTVMVREYIGKKVVEVPRSVYSDQISAITQTTGRPVQLTLF